MAIKISGTTVISDSCNIENVGTVTATTLCGDGSNITGLGGGVDVCTMTTSGTYTAPPTASYIQVHLVGGGGGGAFGGGCSSPCPQYSTAEGGAGGGGGAGIVATYPVTETGPSFCVQIGAGGFGGGAYGPGNCFCPTGGPLFAVRSACDGGRSCIPNLGITVSGGEGADEGSRGGHGGSLGPQYCQTGMCCFVTEPPSHDNNCYFVMNGFTGGFGARDQNFFLQPTPTGGGQGSVFGGGGGGASVGPFGGNGGGGASFYGGGGGGGGAKGGPQSPETGFSGGFGGQAGWTFKNNSAGLPACIPPQGANFGGGVPFECLPEPLKKGPGMGGYGGFTAGCANPQMPPTLIGCQYNQLPADFQQGVSGGSGGFGGGGGGGGTTQDAPNALAPGGDGGPGCATIIAW